VVAAPARPAALSHSLRLTGEIRPLHHARVRAEASGRVVEMPWRIGDHVKSGAVLDRLDGTLNHIEIRRARAALAEAEASAEQAKRKLERTQALFDDKKVSLETHDNSAFGARKAEATREMRRSELDRLKRLAEDFELRAPYDAYLSAIDIQEGDFVSPGTAAFSLVEAGVAKAVFQVPADQIADFRHDQHFSIRVPALARDFDGRVAAIAREADPKSRTFTLELDLASSPQLRPGLIAQVATTIETKRRALFVPARALVEKFGGSYLFVVVDGRARERPVSIEQRRGEEVAVSGELAAGALVVVRGQHRLADGQSVQILGDDAAPAIVAQ